MNPFSVILLFVFFVWLSDANAILNCHFLSFWSFFFVVDEFREYTPPPPQTFFFLENELWIFVTCMIVCMQEYRPVLTPRVGSQISTRHHLLYTIGWNWKHMLKDFTVLFSVSGYWIEYESDFQKTNNSCWIHLTCTIDLQINIFAH